MGLSSPLKQETNLLSYTIVYDKNLFIGCYWKQFKTFWIFQTFMPKEIKAEQVSGERLLVNVSLITECSTQQARRETGWKSKEANSQTEQSPVRESWVKEGQKV